MKTKGSSSLLKPYRKIILIIVSYIDFKKTSFFRYIETLISRHSTGESRGTQDAYRRSVIQGLFIMISENNYR